jgi:hypothetical protein
MRDAAREAANAAVRETAPADRARLVAALAVRLAEHGHAKVVNVDVAGTREAFEAVRSFLDEWRENGSRPEGVPSVSSVSVQDGGPRL